MTQYAIVGLKDYRVEISNKDFALLRTATTHFFEILSIEEKLNLVVENYAEFEKELFNCSLNRMLFGVENWTSGIGGVHSMNRRIVNLLTTCRLYIDQTSHNICSIYGNDSEQEKIFKKQASQEYDSDYPGYRTMEAMRNYVQHRELPVRILNNKMQLVGTGSNELWKHTIKLSIDINTLSKDGKFKKKVLTELQSLGESVELTPLIRQYLRSIGKIHLKIRELLNSDLSAWEEQIRNPLKQYKEATGYVDGLRAIAINESKTIETISILEDVIKRRQMLENKNKYLTHYPFHFISSEAPEIRIES
ncbi:hypothetical protein C7B76_30510 [filamentous cyanobacterium CCP2]|nr:hypothetical protein C7B76_30510 [filamentous cyanobacterium CCP2]